MISECRSVMSILKEKTSAINIRSCLEIIECSSYAMNRIPERVVKNTLSIWRNFSGHSIDFHFRVHCQRCFSGDLGFKFLY